MPFSSQEITDAGKTSIDMYLKNKPIDQVAVARPWLRKLMAMKKSFPGAKQYIVEQLRFNYGSNFTWYYGSQTVSYNSRQTIEQAQYSWRSAHDGFFLDEDRLLQNGIIWNEQGRGGESSRAEAIQLTNLLNEQTESLRLGFEEQFSLDLHRAGVPANEEIEGLDHIVSLTPTTGTTGGLNRATYTWWRNNVQTGVTAGQTKDKTEEQWRACIRNGGAPDFCLAGELWVDQYRTDFTTDGTDIIGMFEFSPNRQSEIYDAVQHREETDTGLRVHGRVMHWDPEFQTLDTEDSPATLWEKRCYLINCRFLKLRPAEGHDMVSRNPPRVYNRYVHYWALTWKGALCSGRLHAHSVMALA